MGLIRTDKSDKKLRLRQADDNFARTQKIVIELDRLVAKYDIRLICFEAFSPVRSASVAAQLGHSYGAIAALVTLRGLPVASVTPQETRKAFGAASKDEIAETVYVRHKKAGKEAMIRFAKDFKRNEANHNHAWDSIGVFEACKESSIILALRRR